MKFKCVTSLILTGLLCLGIAPAAFAADASQLDLGGSQPVKASDLPEGTFAVSLAASDENIQATNCQLTVAKSAMNVTVTLSDDSYSALYLGTKDAAEKASASDSSYCEATLSKKGASQFTFAVKALNTAFDMALCSKADSSWTGCTAAITADELYGDVISAKSFSTEQSDPYVGAVNVGLDDGTYSVDVTLAGGSGKASVTSPCTVTVKDGKAMAQVEWSSPYYDYMIVDGYEYLPINDDGNSVFEIPITNAEFPMGFFADTTAMGTPHEIEYTLSFDFDNAKASAGSADVSGSSAAVPGWLIGLIVVVIIVVVAAIYIIRFKSTQK